MAYSFNGSSDNMEITSALVSATPLTLFARFQPTTVAAGNASIVSVTGSSGSHSFQLRRNGSSIEAFSGEGAAGGAASIPGLIANSSYNCAAIFTSSTSRTIRAGTATSATDTTAVTVTSLDRTNIGARYNAGSLGAFFAGLIGEVAIWNVAITSEEFAQLWYGFSPLLIRPDSLVAYFPLVAHADDLLESRSFTVTGAAPTSTHFAVHYPPRRRLLSVGG
jgi:hypothetical protein